MAANDDFKKIINKIQKTVQSQIVSNKTMRELGNKSRTLIIQRTRRGKGVATAGGIEVRFKPLKRRTIARRQALRNQGVLSSLTTPARSALTETGEMLNSLKVTVKSNRAEIRATGNLQKLKATVHEKGLRPVPKRPFMNLSRKQVKQIKNLFELIISRILDKSLK